MIFEKPSTRTRVSFDVGIKQLGGQSLNLSGSDIHLGHGESIEDTAKVLSRYVDLIIIRTFEEETLYKFARNADIHCGCLRSRSHIQKAGYASPLFCVSTNAQAFGGNT